MKQKRGKGYVDAAGSAPSPAPARTGSKLGKALAALDPLLKEKLPAVFASLRPGADATKSAKLRKALGGKDLPADLVTFFAWHDGQKSAVSFSSEDTYFLHSLASAAEAWEFLNDPTEEVQKPIERTWLPLFENGAGDHRMFDVPSGAIVGFFHDDARRPKEYASLLAWAREMRGQLEKLRAARPVEASLGGLKWTRAERLPGEGQIAKCPGGTAFHYSYENAMGKVRQQLFLKVRQGEWLQSSHPDLAVALERLEEYLRTPPGKESGYWKGDSEVAYDIKDKGKGSLRQAAVASMSS